MTAPAFDPLVAATMSDEKLADTLRDVTMFQFDKFRPADLIDEIPKYCAAINLTFDHLWSSVDGAEKYDLDLMKKKEKEPEKYEDHTWQSDRIENFRRVWEWWRAKAPAFSYFFTATRLVAIAPISSASVERCFSQDKFVLEAIG